MSDVVWKQVQYAYAWVCDIDIAKSPRLPGLVFDLPGLATLCPPTKSARCVLSLLNPNADDELAI